MSISLDDFRFAYVYNGEIAGAEPTLWHITECNFRGPILQTCRPLIHEEEDLIRQPTTVAYIDSGRYFAGLQNSGFREIRTTDVGLQVHPWSSPRPTSNAVYSMFDREANRVFCLTSGGFQVGEGDRWSRMEMAAAFPEAWCHDDVKKCFYFLIRNGRTITEVHQVSEQGATVRKSKLPVPIPCPFNPNERLCFAYCDGNYIVVVLRDPNGRDTTSNEVFVVDMKTFGVVHRGKFLPHIEYEPMDRPRFERLWEQLGVAKEYELAPLKWQLTSGLRDSSKFIGEQVGVGTSAIDIAIVVERLNADRFDDRDAAFQELRRKGRPHKRLLEERMESNELSAEQRARIAYLLSAWDKVDARFAVGQEVLEVINELTKQP